MIAAPIIAVALLAPASTGAGIQGTPVCPASAVQPGRSYDLGSISVQNPPGDSYESLSLAVAPLFGGQDSPIAGARPVPVSWVSFGYGKTLGIFPRHSLGLAAGSSGSVTATLTVPAGTPAGYWVANIVAGEPAASSAGGGVTATLSADAATLLEVSVGRPYRCVDPDAGVAASQASPAPPSSAPAATSTPAAAAPVSLAKVTVPKKLPSDWDGWAFVIGIIVIVVFTVRRKLRA